MAKKIRSGHIIVDRDNADALSAIGRRSQSMVEFDLVFDSEAGRLGDYTEIIIRLGNESMRVEIPEGARWHWLELMDSINEISRRPERYPPIFTNDAA